MLQLFYLLSADPKNGGTVQLLMMGAIMLVFYLFMIRPQAKKPKCKRHLSMILRKVTKL